jgi:hypothetical protein
MDGYFGLAAVLGALRDELESAWHDGQGRAIHFQATEVTLTMSAVARCDVEGSGRIRWYVAEAGGRKSSSDEESQVLVLKLTPTLSDGQGHTEPLPISAQQSSPGR